MMTVIIDAGATTVHLQRTVDDMATTSPDLGAPLVMARGGVIRNRLARAALSEGLSDEHGRPSPALHELYRRWSSEGGHGLIVTGNVMIDARQLGESGNVVGDRRDAATLDAFHAWARAAKTGGNRIWMQVNHPGRQAQMFLTRNRPVAPSAVRPPIPGAVTPRALTGGEIDDLIARYAATARLAQDTGFDGVQLHGAHGYLISQFLSPLANQRTDAWGGDADRRMRFVLHVLRACRSAVDPGFPIGIKLNSADFQRGGFDEEESMRVVDALVAEGVDLVEVSGGTYGSPAMVGTVTRESTRAREAYFQDYAEEVRRRTPSVTLMLTGGFRTRAGMQRALDDGACDLVGIARATCIAPGAAAHVLDGRRTDAPVITRTVGGRRVGLRALAARFGDLRVLDAAVDMAWQGQQMHRMGAGKDPKPGMPWFVALAHAVRREGLTAVRPKRG